MAKPLGIPLAIVASTLGHIGLIKSTYELVKRIDGMPEAFRSVQSHLPLVETTLTGVRYRLRRDPDPTREEEVQISTRLKSCEGNTKKLLDILENVELAYRYKSASQAFPQELYHELYLQLPGGRRFNRAERLMTNILTDLRLLLPYPVFEDFGNDLQAVSKAIDELSEVMESKAPESGETRPINNHPDSRQSSSATKRVLERRGVAPNSPPAVDELNDGIHGNESDVVDYHGKAVHRACRVIPYIRNQDFVGRIEILDWLHKLLSTTSKHKSAALWGLGGIGKTQIALQYAWCQDPVCSVFWVSAQNASTFARDYGVIASHLGLPDGLDDHEMLNAVRKKIEAHPPWLLVLDNADDPALFSGVSPVGTDSLLSHVPSGKGGNVLWTSRDAGIVDLLDGAEQGFQVEAMSVHEGRALLEKASPRFVEDGVIHDADRLLNELAFVPLAISQATQYILTRSSQTRSMTIEQYLTKLVGANLKIEKHPGLAEGSLASISGNLRWEEGQHLMQRDLDPGRRFNAPVEVGDAMSTLLESVAPSRAFTGDSGYYTRTVESSKMQHEYGILIRGHKAQGAIDEESGSLDEESSVPAGGDRQAEDACTPPSVAGTEYSLAESVDNQRVGRHIMAMVQLFASAMPQGILDASIVQSMGLDLREILRTFALMMGHSGSSSEERTIMFFVHKHSEDVIRAIFRIGHEAAEDQDQPRPNVSNEKPMTSEDKVSGYLAMLDVTSEPEEQPQMLSHGHDAGDDDLATLDLERFEKCAVESAAYAWLKATLLVAATHTDASRNIRKEIRDIVMQSLHSSVSQRKISRHKAPDIYQATIEVEWDPFSFITEQCYKQSPEDAIVSAITLTGSTQDCQALVTSQYLSRVWPSSSDCMVQLLRLVSAGNPVTWTDGTTVTAQMASEHFIWTAVGLGSRIAEVVEQVAWLGAALRSRYSDSPSASNDDGLFYCTPSVEFESDKSTTDFMSQNAHCRFKICYETSPGKVERQINGHCWQSMFRRPVVVQGYPIAQRTTEETGLGLDMPLNMMTRLVKATHIMPFGPTWIIKGFSSMLALSGVQAGIFLWHHIYHPNGDRVSYFDKEAPKPPANLVSAVELSSGRHVVGWCSDVKLYTNIPSEINLKVEPSGLDPPSATCVLEKVSFSAGKIVSGGGSIAIGVKDKPLHLTRDTYLQKLQWVSGQYAILWDEKDNRGWLVNGASALLHLTLATLDHEIRFWKRAGVSDSEILFKRAGDVIEDPPDSLESDLALKLLYRNRKNKLLAKEADDREDKMSSSKFTTFKHMVEKQYSALEQIMDQQFHIEDRSGLNLKLRARKCLEGWDFHDLAVTTKRSPIYPRLKTLDTMACGWVDFTREIKAITIFGKGFGELIQPTEKMCATWASLPSKRFYLAACVSDLREIMGLTDDGDISRESPLSICSDLQWHVKGSLFHSCDQPTTGGASVKHLADVSHVLAPSGTLWKWLRTKQTCAPNVVVLKNSGAVVFGYSKLFGLKWPDMGIPVEEEDGATADELAATHAVTVSADGGAVGVQNIPNLGDGSSSQGDSSTGTAIGNLSTASASANTAATSHEQSTVPDTASVSNKDVVPKAHATPPQQHAASSRRSASPTEDIETPSLQAATPTNRDTVGQPSGSRPSRAGPLRPPGSGVRATLKAMFKPKRTGNDHA